MKASEFRKLYGRIPARTTVRKSHTNARKVDTPHGRFDSQGEYKRYVELADMQGRGLIHQLHRPGSLPLLGADGARVKGYKPDFCYVETGMIIYEDFKGRRFRELPTIIKLWQSTYPDIELRITGPGARP